MMMKKITAALVGVAMLGCWPLVSSYAQESETEAAEMPELVILVVSRQQVMIQSKAGQDMREKLKTVFEEIDAAEKEAQDKVIADAQELVKKKAIMSSEDFKKQQLQLGQEEQFNTYKFDKERGATRAAAQEQIVSAMVPILQDLMKQYSGTILLDESNLVLAVMDYNITSEVVTRLDAVLPTVEVKRITFDELVARQKAAQEATGDSADTAAEE